MLEIVGNGWNWQESEWKWLKMAGNCLNDQKWLAMDGMGDLGNFWNWQKGQENCCKWLEMALMTVNGWKQMVLACG